MSLINDALKRAENAKLDKLSDAESQTEMPSATYGQPTRKRLFGSITLVCLLVIGGGFAGYRYWGPGDGPGPQAATAEIKPVEPKEWVNPAFKALTPEAANDKRAEIAGSVVKQFFDSGTSLHGYTTSLSTAGAEIVAKAEVKAKRDAEYKAKRDAKLKAKLEAEAKARAKARPIPSAMAAGMDPTKFHVNGIMFNGPNSMVIINEGVYRIGQKVSGAVVENITPSAVILRVGDKRFKVGM